MFGIPLFTFILGVNLLAASFGGKSGQVETRQSHMREQDHLDLLIFVLSAPDNYEKREVIRTTWLSHQHGDVRGYFVIGTKNLSSTQLNSLDQENQEYDDLVLLNIVDTYSKLTNKVLSMIIYANNFFSASLFMKTDDDIFVNTMQLEKEVKKMKKEPLLYWGYFDGRGPILKKGKWAQKRYVLCDTYLPYAFGGGYIISWPLVDVIAQFAPLLVQYNCEDVSVGTWLAPINVNRIHDERFDTDGGGSRGCQNHFLLTMEKSPDDMRDMWARLSTGGPLCEKEVIHKASYAYNWELPPSQCCAAKH